MKKKLRTHSPEETAELARQLTTQIQRPALVLMEGEMGSGKTFFVKAFTEATGSQDFTSSPTFSIINLYNTPQGEIYHLDLYRIEDPDELYAIGFDEILDNKEAITFIEWPEIAEIDKADYIIRFEREDNDSRIIEIEGQNNIEVNINGN